MRVLVIAAMALAFGSAAAFADGNCNWTATAAKSSSVVARSDQGAGGASAQPVKRAENKG